MEQKDLKVALELVEKLNASFEETLKIDNLATLKHPNILALFNDQGMCLTLLKNILTKGLE